MTDAPRSTLYLLRHAHSSWAQPGQRDHQRPLDARGRTDALALGPSLLQAGDGIDAVVCSTALRAAETLAALRPHLPASTPVETSDDLYALGVEAYIAAARAHDSCRCLLLVGHNPMVEECAAMLAGSGEASALALLAEGFPTAGLAVIDFQTSLAGIGPGAGYLRRLMRPRDTAGG
jgi:phosphohistidine phosphatase